MFLSGSIQSQESIDEMVARSNAVMERIRTDKRFAHKVDKLILDVLKGRWSPTFPESKCGRVKAKNTRQGKTKVPHGKAINGRKKAASRI